ncbi:MAG: acriflavin resistance protein [Verrucomicrobiaceae bacterium]|nr:acriflavin resistance protein [Verrucomicrobiaceae bacterium]
MNFVTWSIRNPMPVIVLFVLLMIMGIISFTKLPVIDMPEIDFPGITVTVNYPGVQPSQLETEVTRKIEDSVASVLGIRHINSTVSEGMSFTRIDFELDRDINEALDDVRDAVSRIRSDLPADANEPVISRINISGRPIITFAVAADNLSETELSWLVDLTLTRELSAVHGVGKISRVGGVAREIRVDLNFDRITSLGTTATDISRQLKRFQAEFPGGEARVGDGKQSIRTVGTINSLRDLAELPISLPDGRRVRLDNIATIRDQAAEREQIALLDGKQVVGFEITRAKGTSALDVAERVRAKVDELNQKNPHVKIQEISNTVDHIRESYHSSLEMLVEGALLAIIVVWYFLRDWRATLVSAIALPLSIFPTFWAMHALGYSLNNLTLLALSLVVGVLVDDAIVEIENIVRHLRQGKPPLEAARDAALEIGLAVIATTFTLCAVFVPVAFMGGIPGEFFRPFAFTATVSVLFSLLVARLLTPMLASRFLKPHDEHEETGPFTLRYVGWVQACLKHRRITLSASAVIIGLSIGVAPLVPKGFSTETDTGYAVLSIELPPGSTLENTRATAEIIRQRLQNFPEIKSMYTVMGRDAGNAVSATIASTRNADITIALVPRKERKLSQQKVQQRVLYELRDIPGIRLSYASDWASKMQLTFASDDPPLLDATMIGIERELRALPSIGQLTSKTSLLTPEVVIRPLPERAAELGVNTEAIALVARFATSGDVLMGLAKMNLPSRQLPIRVRLSDDARDNLDLIRLLPVPSKNGTVPLMNVAEVRLDTGPAQITRYDRSRVATIDVDLNGRALGDVMKSVATLPSIKQLPADVHQLAAGQIEFMVELFKGFGIAMLVGILSIYVVLVLLFKEFLQPITILSALPPSAAGAIVCLYVLGYSLSVPSLIGILMLMGIVTKNSILLVEYAEMARRDHHLPRTKALLDACAKRARPIVMTTIAMIAGMLPVALGFSGDSSFQTSMGAVVISGLLVSTALSLFVVPVVFSFIDDIQIKLSQLRGRPAAPVEQVQQ